MFHFPYRAPASFAKCQTDSISSTFAMFKTIVFIKFFVPLQTLFLPLKIAIFSRIVSRSKSKNPQTLANFTSIKQWFSTRSPPEILCVDKIQIHGRVAIRDCRSPPGKTTQSKISCAPRISADRKYADIVQPAENYRATPTAASANSCLHSQKES